MPIYSYKSIGRGSYYFITSSGIRYEIFFLATPFTFVDNQGNAMNDTFIEFAFTPVNLNFKIDYDPNTMETIVSILTHAFINYPEMIIYYKCDRSDSRQLARSKLFWRVFDGLPNKNGIAHISSQHNGNVAGMLFNEQIHDHHLLDLLNVVVSVI